MSEALNLLLLFSVSFCAWDAELYFYWIINSHEAASEPHTTNKKIRKIDYIEIKLNTRVFICALQPGIRITRLCTSMHQYVHYAVVSSWHVSTPP
jgi:hypothetical protein